MKRLAFWIIVGLVVLNVASRRESRARDELRRAARAEQTARAEQATRVIVVQHGDDDEESSIVITRGRQGRVQSIQAPPQPPRPPVPPVPPHRLERRGRPLPPPPPPAVVETSKATPDWFPRNREQEVELAKADRSGRRVLVGPLSPSPTEAKKALRDRVRREVFNWLTPEMAEIGEPSERELDSLVRATHVQPVLVDIEKPDLAAVENPPSKGEVDGVDNLYTIYKAGQIVDFSDAARDRVVKSYRNRLVHERLLKGGGILGFALVGLGALTGYIRADEATKGKYRRRLRTLAALAIGGAGYAFYRWTV